MADVSTGFSAEDVRKAVFADNRPTQDIFRAEFAAEIERAIRGIAAAHRALDLFRSKAQPSILSAALELLFHSGINSVLVSVHHLVSGFPISAGNLMRHYTESVALALLCLDPDLAVPQAIAAGKMPFPVQSAPRKLRQKKVRRVLKERIEFDIAAWNTVMQISKLYDEFSHSSLFAMTHHKLLDQDNLFILGSEYDPARGDFYRSDLVRRASAAEALAHLIEIVTDRVCATAPHP